LKTSAFILFLIMASHCGFGQDHEQPARFKPKAYFGIIFQPNVDFRILKNESDAPIAPYLLDTRQENEAAKFGYNFGLDVNIHLTENIGIETGFQYADKGYRHKVQEIPYFIPVPGQATHSGFDYRYHHVTFPLGLHIRAGKGKLKFSSAIGVSFAYLAFVSSTQIYKYEDGETETQWESATGDFKEFNVFPYVGAGFMYAFTDRILLRAEPTVRFGALRVTDEPLTTYLWSTGLRISVLFR
jgi:hypothetical protein